MTPNLQSEFLFVKRGVKGLIANYELGLPVIRQIIIIVYYNTKQFDISFIVEHKPDLQT